MKLIQIQTVPVGEIQANCYVLSLPERDDALVIDPGAEEPAIRLALGKRRIAAILLTHGHYDHIGAVAALRAGGVPSQGEAEYTLSDGDEMTLAGIRLRVLHTPGHTKGGCCFLTDEGQLFSGDTLFRYGYGRTDLPGGDEKQHHPEKYEIVINTDELVCHAYQGEKPQPGDYS